MHILHIFTRKYIYLKRYLSIFCAGTPQLLEKFSEQTSGSDLHGRGRRTKDRWNESSSVEQDSCKKAETAAGDKGTDDDISGDGDGDVCIVKKIQIKSGMPLMEK